MRSLSADGSRRGPRHPRRVPRLDEHEVCPTREVTDHSSVEDKFTRAIAESRARKLLPHPVARRALRLHTGVTQAMIAEVIGVSRPSAARYEAGLITPRGEVLLRYIEVLNLLAVEAAGDSQMLDPAGQPGRAETATPCRRDGF